MDQIGKPEGPYFVLEYTCVYSSGDVMWLSYNNDDDEEDPAVRRIRTPHALYLANHQSYDIDVLGLAGIPAIDLSGFKVKKLILWSTSATIDIGHPRMPKFQTIAFRQWDATCIANSTSRTFEDVTCFRLTRSIHRCNLDMTWFPNLRTMTADDLSEFPLIPNLSRYKSRLAMNFYIFQEIIRISPAVQSIRNVSVYDWNLDSIVKTIENTPSLIDFYFLCSMGSSAWHATNESIGNAVRWNRRLVLALLMGCVPDDCIRIMLCYMPEQLHWKDADDSFVEYKAYGQEFPPTEDDLDHIPPDITPVLVDMA